MLFVRQFEISTSGFFPCQGIDQFKFNFIQQLQLNSIMGLDKRRILETSLFDLEQIVTVQYLSRHADLPIDDARE